MGLMIPELDGEIYPLLTFEGRSFYRIFNARCYDAA